MADGVAVLVGHRHAPGRLRIPRSRGHEVTSQPGVDRAQPGQLAGPARPAGRGTQRHGQRDPPGEPARRTCGRARARGGTRPGSAIVARGARGLGGAGTGVLTEHQVQEGAGAQLIHAALQPGRAQLTRPPADPLIRGQHPVRRQLPAHQRGVAGILGPPLHPREPRRGLPPLPRLARRDLHHRPRQRGPQPAGGQPPGPARDLRLHLPGLVTVKVLGEPHDQLGLAPGDDPVPKRAQRHAEPGGQVPRHRQQPVRRGPGLAQRQGQLIPGELVHHLGHPPRPRLEPVLRVPPEHLRDGRQLAGGHMRLGPVKGAHQPDQLMIRHPAKGVSRPAVGRRGISGHAQLGAPRHHIPRHPGPEPGRPAIRHAREDPRRPRLARPPPPRAGRVQPEHLIGRRLADPGQLPGGQLVLARRRRACLGVPVLLRVIERVVILGAQPVQPRLPLRRRHRVAVQPGGIPVPPGIR